MSRIVDGEIVVSTERLASLQLAAERYLAVRDAYVAADFADPQFPDSVVLKFAFPLSGLRVSSDCDATIDEAIRLAAEKVTP
jgi:hypothetical protein